MTNRVAVVAKMDNFSMRQHVFDALPLISNFLLCVPSLSAAVHLCLRQCKLSDDNVGEAIHLAKK